MTEAESITETGGGCHQEEKNIEISADGRQFVSDTQFFDRGIGK